MNPVRASLSSAVTTFLTITALILPAKASAQFTAHAARTSSSAVANQGDSIPAVLAI